MAQPQYRLSAPNTGSYQLAPQASPVSVFTRTKQLDPKFETDQNQIKAFQSFVKDLADWRQAENEDNREQAKLRALADNARGELDANLEAEDEDYQKYGRFLQGKNYSKEIGSRLVTEITVGSEGKPGLMDQAFAEAKKAENANRKVEDIFSELLEERKDYYRSQVPDSSDEFYSGFGEGFQPFANEINKAFYERVQKETYSDRRENFADGLRSQIETDVLAVSRKKKVIEFNQDYLRAFAANNGAAAGLSDDAALGEAIRIWQQEVGELILNAESDEDLEIVEDMLDVFDTPSKGRARLIDIPVFQKEAQSAYVTLGKAIETKRDEIEREEEEAKKERRSKQEIEAVLDVVAKNGELDIAAVQKANPDLEAEDLTQLIALSDKIKEKGLKEKPSDPMVFGDAYIASKNGSLTREKALKYLTEDKTINKKDFATLINNIESSTKISKPVRDYIEGRLVDVELERLPLIFRGKDGLVTFETTRPDDYRAFKRSLLDLKLKIYDSTDKHLKDNNLELTTENQVKIMDKVLKDLEPDINKHNAFVKGIFGNDKSVINEEDDSEQSRAQRIDTKYFGDEKGWIALYEDFLQLSLTERGKLTGGSDALMEDNAFKGLSLAEARKLLPQLKSKLKAENIPGFNEWAYQRIKSTNMGHWSMNNAMRDAYRSVWERVGKGEDFPEPTTLENILGVVGKKVQSNDNATETQRRISARRSSQKVGTDVKKEKYSESQTESRKSARR